MVKFAGAILKITRRPNLKIQGKSKPQHESLTTRTLLVLGKPLRGIIGNVIVPRGTILSMLQIVIDRSIKLEMMFTEYVSGFNHI